MSMRRWIFSNLDEARNSWNEQDQTDNGKTAHSWDLRDLSPCFMQVGHDQLHADKHQDYWKSKG